MSLRLGDTVGSYEVAGFLGSGGSGEVYEVKHTVTGRIEALKLLRGAGHRDPDRDARFLREVRLQAKLSHPNIAAVHNAFWLDDDLIMIFELVQGHSLRWVLDAGRTPIVLALDYASQALSALAYTHGAGVIHRDITPSNILITQEGVVKLTDFGLAKPQGDSAPGAGGTLAGSAYYMSPEQIRAKGEIDYRSDLYSVGIVLYEMATGRVPFPGENLYAVMEAHIEQAAVPPSELDSQVSPLLNDVILKAMEKDPAKRFQSAAEFASAVAALVPSVVSPAAAVSMPAAPGPETAPAKAHSPDPTSHDPHSREPNASVETPGPKSERRDRRFYLPLLGRHGARALIAATGIVVIALAAALWPTPEPAPAVAEQEPAEPAQVQTASVPRPDPPREFVGPVLPPGVMESRAAEAGTGVRAQQPRPAPSEREPEPPSPSEITPRPPTERASREEPNSRQSESTPEDKPSALGSPSPAGGQVAEGASPSAPESATRRLASPVEKTQSAAAGQPRGESEAAFELVGRFDVGDTVWAVAFSHDGRRIAAGMENRGVGVWAAGGGKQTASFHGHSDRVVAVAFSPDGKRLASGSADGTAKLWNLADKRETRTLGHKDGVTSLAFSPDGRRLASGSSDKALNIWDLTPGGAFHEYRGHKRPAQAVAFSPNGKWLASGSIERDVRLWSLADPDRPVRVEGLEHGVSAVAFSHDGKSLAVAGGNRVKLMDVAQRLQLRSSHIPGWRYAIAFTRDGRCLALSAQSAPPGAVKLWDISQPEPLTTLTEAGTVRSVAISSDGSRLAAATDGGSVSVWERVERPVAGVRP